jgi:hypothetical protein
MPNHALRLTCCALILLAVVAPANAAAQDSTRASLVGTWHGTSTCVDKEAFPACHDEDVIYVVQPVAASPDSVTVRADKVVNGTREFMGELAFGRGARGEWSSVLQSARFRGRWTLSVDGDRMSGALVDVPTGRRVRAVLLRRTASSPP